MIGLINTFWYAVVVLLAIGLGTYLDADSGSASQEHIEVFRGLIKLASTPHEKLSMALGYNVCLDAIARASDVLGIAAGDAVNGVDHAVLASADEVKETFINYYREGAAAERSCAADVLAAFTAAAEASPGLKKSLGGNAALMARRIAAYAPNARVLLGGHIGPGAQALLPPAVQLVSPPSAVDDVHLILEYGKGEMMAGHSAPRANRFIVTASLDFYPDASGMVATIRAADAQGADSITVAGLHMLEPLPSAQRQAALDAIAHALTSRSGRAPVHIELASCADPAFMRAIAATLFPHASSLGANEQEFAFLYEAIGGRYDDDVSGFSRADVASTRPLPVAVAAMLRSIMEAHPSSPLSRLHYHSLAFHMVAYCRDSVARGKPVWRGGEGAVSAGAVAATTEACRLNASDVSPDAISIIAPLRFTTADPRAGDTCSSASGSKSQKTTKSSTCSSGGCSEAVVTPSDPVVTWLWQSSVGPLAFRLAPVAVCHKPVSTVGLGDAISATALAADTVKLS